MIRLSALALLIACGGNSDALQRENDALRARIVVLEAQNETLQRQVRAAQRPRSEAPQSVELPARADPSTFNVMLVANGTVLVDGDAVSDASLATRARAAGPDTRAVIAADRGVPYQRVVQIMDILRSNGIEDLVLAVQPN